MRTVLLQVDTDPRCSAFDAIAALDSGAEVLLPYSGVTAETVRSIVEGAIFTRGGDDLKRTAIWIGGYDVAVGEQILAVVRKTFFAGFRVSVMLDSNGCNTTAAAAVAKLTRLVDVRGKKVVVVGGAGPVGQRVCGLFGQEGAEVTVTSIRTEWLNEAVQRVHDRFGVRITPVLVMNEDTMGYARLLENAVAAFGAGPAGIRLLPLAAWKDNPTLEVIADLNLSPPSGVEGIEVPDDGAERYGKRCFGPVGLGNFKMKVHRACVAALFEAKDQVLEAEAVYRIARELH